MKTSVGKTKLELASGDISRLAVDALATPTTTRLLMDSGVGAAIRRAGGEAIEKEATLQGPAEVGKAVVTTGQKLTARWVIHVALADDSLETDAAIVAEATRNTLDAAKRCHARSLAMPAFGTGTGGVPLYQCASIMVTETVAWLREHPRHGLRHVMFIVYDDSARAAFKNALAGVSRF